MGTSEEVDRFGRVKTRDGCWRIRSSPDGPSPCSFSSRGDLQKGQCSLSASPVPYVIAYAARRKEAAVDHPLTLEGIQDLYPPNISLTHSFAPRVRQRMDQSPVILKGAPMGTTRD